MEYEGRFEAVLRDVEEHKAMGAAEERRREAEARAEAAKLFARIRDLEGELRARSAVRGQRRAEWSEGQRARFEVNLWSRS